MNGGLCFEILIILFANVRGEVFSSDEVMRLDDENSSQNKNGEYDETNNDVADKEAIVENDPGPINLNGKDVTGDSDNETDLSNAIEIYKESNAYFMNANTEIINETTNDDINASIGNKTFFANEDEISSKNYEKNYKTSKNESGDNKHNSKEEIQEIFSSGEERNSINVIHESENVAEEFGDSLKSARYSSVEHYFCMAKQPNESHLILYGTKTWTFPLQDVNLTLNYPPEKSPMDSGENDDYIITGFELVLYIDGVESRGYITRGGVLQERISLSFISSGITKLLYKFWLYGTPKNTTNVAEMHSSYFLCS